jgi:glycosyltransferase involved in cell wall biosynthesis
MISSSDISVVIPTSGKREVSILNAVKSVLKQTDPVFEILIIWDGVGEPFKFLHTLSEKIHIIRTQKPLSGVSVARQTGVNHASRDLICILDDDDVWVQTKVADQIGLISKHNDKHNIFSFGRSTLLYENGKIKNTVPIQKFKENDTLVNFFFRKIPLVNARKTCSSSTFMFSKELALKSPFRFDLEADEDTDFIFRINNKCKVFYTHKVITTTTFRSIDGEGLSNTKRNIKDWLEWVESLRSYTDAQVVSNLKVVYGVRHYLKQKKTRQAFKLLVGTLFEKPDLISATTGIMLFFRKIFGK